MLRTTNIPFLLLFFVLTVAREENSRNVAIMSAENSHDDHDTFESAEAGSAKSYPMQCSALRKNGHVLIKNHPCKIVEMSTSKTGKHGHAKVHLVGIDIFQGTKHEENCPSTHNVEVPRVNRQELQILSGNEDGYLCLMKPDCQQREDLKLDPPTGSTSKEYDVIYKELEKRKKNETIEGDSEVESSLYYATVTECMGQERVLDIKKKSD